MLTEAWNNIQSASFKISKMASVTIFKNKDFQIANEQTIRKQEKTYVLDVICNRFYFGEVQEEVLGQYSGEGISAPRKEGLSVYQWSVPNKRAGWLRKCLCKYSSEVFRFVLKLWEIEVHYKCDSIKVCNTP